MENPLPIMTIDNFNTCMVILNKYMYEQFNVNINEMYTSKELNTKVFTALQEQVNNDMNSGMNIKQINNIVIQDVIKQIRHDLKIQNDKQKNNGIKSLDRETAVYGQRPMMKIPGNLNMSTNNNDKTEVDRRFDELLSARKPSDDPPRSINSLAEPVNIEVLPEKEFNDKLTFLEQQRRDNYMDINRDIVQKKEDYDPKAFYMDIQKKKDDLLNLQDKQPLNYLNTSRQVELIKAPSNILKANYVMINGYDRDWVTFPKRFHFSINIHNMAKTYKNIREISFNRLILPMEIIAKDYFTNQTNIKNKFVNPFGLSFPYIMLNIDEINDVYDSISQSNRKCFTHFVYEHEYTSPNGRGYVILRPIQHERKIFFPANLGSLQRLTISISRPNGTLYNNSMDNYMILKLEYEAYNGLYLKIVTNKYFDKNELYVGDSVYVKNYMMPPVLPGDTSSAEYFEYMANRELYDNINMFINRDEGHEIVQLGDANDSGFYKNFYIYAPGHLDQSIGKIVVDMPLVNQIVLFNNNINLACCQAPYYAIGNIINASLQSTLAMQIITSVGNMIDSENV